MRNRRYGFTLIEVLVVVAIIALLVAILIPSLALAREHAKAAACASNGHQMGLAQQMYTNIYKYTTGHHYYNESVTTTEWVMFPVRLLRAMSGNGKKTGQAQIFWCPSSKIKERWDGVKRIVPQITGGANDFPTFDYGINDWGTDIGNNPNLGLGGHIFDPRYATVSYHEKWRGEVPVERIKRPSNLIGFGDNNADQKGYGNWDTALDPTNPDENIGDRHSKRAMVVWADGHADMQLQSKLNNINKSQGVRAMWNNDAKPH